MKKKLLSLVISIFIISVCFCGIALGFDTPYIAMHIGVPVAVVNSSGKLIDSDSNVCPYIKNDRTMLPVRFIAESLGAEVEWLSDTQTVIIKKSGLVLQLNIGENVMYKNGQAISLDAASEIKNSRTNLPVRAIAEGLNMHVSWNDGLITIYDDKNMTEAQKQSTEENIIKDVEKLCRDNSIMPLAVNISLGGQILKGFDPMCNTYTLRSKTTDPADFYIAAIADEFSTASVSLPDSFPGDVKITVRGKVFDGLENVYTIKVKEPLPFKIYAKGTQPGNIPENTVDDDFQTRWAAEGTQWIMYEFNEPVELSKVKIAFWKASETRKASFYIQTRLSPEEKWTTVYKGTSTLSTEELETFEFEKHKVKFLRITGTGNTENKWNSFLEVRFE